MKKLVNKSFVVELFISLLSGGIAYLLYDIFLNEASRIQ